jgi:SAM-dependent methyltransferase
MISICPYCKSRLSPRPHLPANCACGRLYPRLASGGLDFLQGNGFPDFDLDPADRQQRQCLHWEVEGVADRVQHFLLPALKRYCTLSGHRPGELAVLDCGCGAGVSVDLLRAEHFDAWGVDAGRSRHQQWKDRDSGDFLVSANALALPFDDASFDVVISSGLIEHIGIFETVEGHYIARRLPDCHAQRRQFAGELLRVLAKDGFILLDHPNGSFPVDFWHGTPARPFRLHLSSGDMLPTFREVEDYFCTGEPGIELVSLSPQGRLRLGRVRRSWYGRAVVPIVRAWLKLLAIPSASALTRSCLNPYLVTVITRNRVDPAALRKWFQPD